MDPLARFLLGGAAGGSAAASHWIATLGGGSSEDGFGIAVDGSNNVYVVGETDSQGAGSNDLLVVKYNTSGVIQWQRSLGGVNEDSGYAIAVDSSSNVYVVGSCDFESAKWILAAKYNTSGVIQWQRRLGDWDFHWGYGAAVDSSGNLYVAGSSLSGIIVAKYNTSGVIQWQRSLGTGSSNRRAIAVDSSGNVYVVGTAAGIIVAKYNTSGVIQWQRTLGGASSETGYGIAVDSSGNAYVVGCTSTQGAGGGDLLVAKYNTTGVLQWQRRLGGAGSELGYGIAVNNSGSLYVVGTTTTTGDGIAELLIAKLPGDGSKTGSYVELTYAATTLTSAAVTLTDGIGALTDGAGALTDAAASLTDGQRTLTASTTTI